MITFRDPSDDATGTIDAGVITCTNPAVQSILRTLSGRRPAPQAGQPDPDLETFRYLVAVGPFKLQLLHEDPPPSRITGRIS